jgi:hypothetical protein
MKLSYKDKQFLIETIEYRLNAYQEHLKIENLDEDEISDIGNDSKFLQSLCNDLTKSLNQNDTSQGDDSSVSVNGDVKDMKLSSILTLSWEDLVKHILKLSVKERLILMDAITESLRQELSLNHIEDSALQKVS